MINRKFWYATAALMGTMIGVGIFGLPFSFSKSGFLFGIVFLAVVAGLTLLVDLMYGEVILRTHDKHQLIGYTKKYLGTGWQRLIFFTATLTGYAALLAYIIIAGDFLSIIFSPFFYVSLTTYSVLFFIILSLLTARGLKTISWVELMIAGLLAVAVLLMLIFGFNKINYSNFVLNPTDLWFLPYGVLIFAFAGLIGVPIQREILINKETNLKRSIVTAVLIVAALYLVFSFLVVGVSGDLTSPDAISGLFEFLGSRITFLGALFGVLAVSTSFLMLSSGMIEIFTYDFGLRRSRAWVLAVLPSFLLYLGGLRTFVDIVGFAGAVALGLEYFVVIFLFIRAKRHGDRVPEYSLSIPRFILYIMMALFLAGISYSLFIK